MNGRRAGRIRLRLHPGAGSLGIVASSLTPQPDGVRRRALVRGCFSLAGAVLLLFAAGWSIGILRLEDRMAMWLLRLGLLAADVALVYSVWQLGVARDRRWDWRGLSALVVMLVAWPTLLMFVTWTAMAAFVMVTGRPLRLFGD